VPRRSRSAFRSRRAHWLEIESACRLIRERDRRCDDREQRRCQQHGGLIGWKRERERERERERRRREEGGRHAASPASRHPVDPIFFKRSAHSSQPDSLTIIKRKSLYSALSFRPRTYFLPSPVSTSPLAPVLSPRLPHCCTLIALSRLYAVPASFRSFSSSRPPPPPPPPPLPPRYCSHCAADYFIIQLLSFARQKAPSPATRRTGERAARRIEGGAGTGRRKRAKDGRVSHLISSPPTESVTARSPSLSVSVASETTTKRRARRRQREKERPRRRLRWTRAWREKQCDPFTPRLFHVCGKSVTVTNPRCRATGIIPLIRSFAARVQITLHGSSRSCLGMHAKGARARGVTSIDWSE